MVIVLVIWEVQIYVPSYHQLAKPISVPYEAYPGDAPNIFLSGSIDPFLTELQIHKSTSPIRALSVSPLSLCLPTLVAHFVPTSAFLSIHMILQLRLLALWHFKVTLRLDLWEGVGERYLSVAAIPVTERCHEVCFEACDLHFTFLVVVRGRNTVGWGQLCGFIFLWASWLFSFGGQNMQWA